jgi:flagellar assembly factor FliW
MVKVNTTRFGTIEVEEKRIITIKGGMLGFPGMVRYVILDHSRESPFKWLQSVDNPSIAFVITDPLIFIPHYRISLNSIEMSEIEIEDPEKAICFVVVNIAKDYSLITLNLQGPVIVNTEKGLAKQVVLLDSSYSIRHVIYSKEVSLSFNEASIEQR